MAISRRAWPSRRSTWRSRRATRRPASSITPIAACNTPQAEYAARLTSAASNARMSRPGNPYDNAKAESFMKTLKAEEANATAYVDLEDARSRIGAFIDEVYNENRLYSALGNKSPVAFEAQ